ncbi:unknown [Odoribacter laneus CAG:561]|nr:unknown [Odoribacter laneus CAG:561]
MHFIQFTAMTSRTCRTTAIPHIFIRKNRIIINRQFTINCIRMRILSKNSIATSILTGDRADLPPFICITQVFKPTTNHRLRIYRFFWLGRGRKITTVYGCHGIFWYNFCPLLFFSRYYNYIIISHHIKM